MIICLNTDPVSYTHLDVYKRQVQASRLMRNAERPRAFDGVVVQSSRLMCNAERSRAVSYTHLGKIGLQIVQHKYKTL